MKIKNFFKKHSVAIGACVIMALICLLSWYVVGQDGGETLTSIGQNMGVVGNLTVGGNVGIGTTSPVARLEIQDNKFALLDLVKTNAPENERRWRLGIDRDFGWFSIRPRMDDGSMINAGLVINRDGNVGIGTTSPTRALHVGAGESAFTSRSGGHGQIRLVDGTSPAVIHRNDGNNYLMLLTDSENQWGSWNSLRPFSFALSSGDVRLGNSTLFVQHGGNVGIGTTSPGAKLDVRGGINYNSRIIERVGNRNGTGTYTLFTNGRNDTQSSGTVEVHAIYGTPSGSGYWLYKISGNRSIYLITSQTSGYSGSTPSVSWNGATLEVSNANSSTYYSVTVRLHEIGNSWNASWGNLPGIAN